MTNASHRPSASLAACPTQWKCRWVGFAKHGGPKYVVYEYSFNTRKPCSLSLSLSLCLSAPTGQGLPHSPGWNAVDCNHSHLRHEKADPRDQECMSRGLAPRMTNPRYHAQKTISHLYTPYRFADGCRQRNCCIMHADRTQRARSHARGGSIITDSPDSSNDLSGQFTS